MLRKIIVSASALLIILAGFGISALMGSGEEVKQQEKNFNTAKFVFTDSVTYAEFPSVINAYGSVLSKNKIAVFAEVPGLMMQTKKEFDVGNYFNEGEILIKIDDRETDLQILSAKSDLITAITNLLPDLKTDFPQSYINWKSYLDNFDLDEKIRPVPDFENDKEKYFLSNRGVLKLYYNIKNLELRKEKHTIRAPFSGTVTQSSVDIGTLISPGQRLGTFSQTNNYEAELSVIQNDLPFISVGNKVKLYSKTSEDEWNGRIIRIGDYINPATQSIQVFVSVSGNGLKDGMYLNAEIEGKTLDNAFRLPRKALYNNEFVYYIKDSILSKRKVNILKLSDEYAYINGLDSNQVVVKQTLVDPELGMKVKSIKKDM